MRLRALGLIALFAAIPTSSLSWFDGLPIDRPAEFILLVLLAALIGSRAARDATFAALGAAGGRAVAVAAVAGIALKALLIVHGGHTGFVACYHGGLTPDTADCDRSFDNPLGRFSATRVDPRIQFDGGDWRLGPLNSLRFDALRRDDDYLPPVPFSAEWRTVAAAASPQRLGVRYRGQAAIEIDGRVEAFPADYSAGGSARVVTVPEGRHHVIVTYRFAPPPPDRSRAVTSASMHVDAGPGVDWGTADRLDRIGARAIDLLAIVVFGLVVGGIVAHAPRDVGRVGGALAIGLLIAIAPIGAYGRDRLLELIVVLAGLSWVWSGRPAIPLAAATLALLCVLRVATGTGPAPGVVEYRRQLNDPLTYESFAHTILEERSPRAGENVFTLQILYRYIRFSERMVFGEADWLLLAAILTASNAAYAWLARRVRLMAAGHGPILLVLTAAMLWLMNSANLALQAPMSEYPTWILAPVSVWLLFLGRGRRHWLVASALMGAAALTRFNQLPAYACLLLVFGVTRVSAGERTAIRDVAGCVAVAAVIAFGLPLAHNYWYGGALTVLPTNRYSTLVIDLPPSAFWTGVPRQTWAMLGWKIQHLAHMGATHATTWLVPLHLLQLAIVATVVAVWRGYVRPLPGHGWLLAAPAIALGVHLFYVVHFYYPRHIMFGYLLGGVVALVWIAEDGLKGTAGRVDLPPVRARMEKS